MFPCRGTSLCFFLLFYDLVAHPVGIRRFLVSFCPSQKENKRRSRLLLRNRSLAPGQKVLARLFLRCWERERGLKRETPRLLRGQRGTRGQISSMRKRKKGRTSLLFSKSESMAKPTPHTSRTPQQKKGERGCVGEELQLLIVVMSKRVR